MVREVSKVVEEKVSTAIAGKKIQKPKIQNEQGER
jgi:hypothetical protein